jgi:hypothetical protein
MLCGHWGIIQPQHRHRYSTDDVVTAWYAKQESRRCGAEAWRILDMGCGIGRTVRHSHDHDHDHDHHTTTSISATTITNTFS